MTDWRIIYTMHGVKLILQKRPRPQNPNSKNQSLLNDISWDLGLEPDSSNRDKIWFLMNE